MAASTGQPPAPPPTALLLPHNPGTIEELHRKCQSVFPMNFEGAKLLVNKGLSSHFQVTHTMTLASTVPSEYRFGATYVGTRMLSPSEAFPLIMCDVNPSGNVNSQIIHAPSLRSRVKFISQIMDKKMGVMPNHRRLQRRHLDIIAHLRQPRHSQWHWCGGHALFEEHHSRPRHGSRVGLPSKSTNSGRSYCSSLLGLKTQHRRQFDFGCHTRQLGSTSCLLLSKVLRRTSNGSRIRGQSPHERMHGHHWL